MSYDSREVRQEKLLKRIADELERANRLKHFELLMGLGNAYSQAAKGAAFKAALDAAYGLTEAPPEPSEVAQ